MNLFGKKKAAPVKPVPNAIEAITGTYILVYIDIIL